jgi:hypothetical protein
MADQSDLDQRYFIDWARYNCPYCKRRHVSYNIISRFVFDWTEKKPATALFAKCHSCSKVSMHLTFEEIPLDGQHWTHGWRFMPSLMEIDDKLFYSVPTSFFVLDSSIPQQLRELFVEAEGCLKTNFLTGASACARKIIYELAARENADGDDYASRIKSLKTLFSDVDSSYFDTLLTVQEITSTKVHESSFDGWEAKHLRVILAAIQEVLHEIYVVPQQRAKKRQEILALRDQLLPKAKPTSPDGESSGA